MGCGVVLSTIWHGCSFGVGGEQQEGGGSEGGGELYLGSVAVYWSWQIGE